MNGRKGLSGILRVTRALAGCRYTPMIIFLFSRWFQVREDWLPQIYHIWFVCCLNSLFAQRVSITTKPPFFFGHTVESGWLLRYLIHPLGGCSYLDDDVTFDMGSIHVSCCLSCCYLQLSCKINIIIHLLSL